MDNESCNRWKLKVVGKNYNINEGIEGIKWKNNTLDYSVNTVYTDITHTYNLIKTKKMHFLLLN